MFTSAEALKHAQDIARTNPAGAAAILAAAKPARAPSAAPQAKVEGGGPVRLTLPYPPSANRYWRTTRQGRTYVSPDAKAYKRAVADRARAALVGPPLAGEVALTLAVFRPRKAGDLSNRIKVLEDALIGIAYRDDAQVRRIVAERFDDKRAPRVEVLVEGTVNS